MSAARIGFNYRERGAHSFPLRPEIIGSGIGAEKFARRVTCALGALGWVADVPMRADIQAALDAGATRDPVLLGDDGVLAQGLVRTEELEQLLRAHIGVSVACGAVP